MRQRLTPWWFLVSIVALAGCGVAASSRPSVGPGVTRHRSAAPSSTVTTSPGTTGPTTASTAVSPAIGRVILEPEAGPTPVYDFLRGARSTLTMTMYELVDPAAEQILAADAARGVEVQVLLDSALEAGANRPALTFLASHGVAVAFAPASRITHQKTICTDDVACLIMSLNLVADDYAGTRDVAVEDSDPSDVSAIESTFMADFAGGTGPARSGDNLLWSPGSEPGIMAVIAGAQKTLAVENEEMDSPAITAALVSAARRGVDVEVCMTEDSAYTEWLADISAAGGHVRLYPDRHGTLYIHEKLVLADAGGPSATAVVGSINFSTSSMDDNRELDVVLHDDTAPGQLAVLDAAFQGDFAGAP